MQCRCEFDVETLKPTYRLIIGAPGKSNAFAISEKLGLPTEIIRRAQALVSTENKSFENVIGKLEASRAQLEKQREEEKRSREEFERFKADAEAEIRKKTATAEQEAEKARKRAAAMVASAKASCDFLYEQMEKMRKAQESAKAAEELEAARRAVREHLRTTGNAYDPVDEPAEEDENYVLPRPLRKGDRVRLVTVNKEGELTDEPKNGMVTFQSGVLRVRARVSDLRLLTDAEIKKKDKQPKSTVTVERSGGFRSEIDLRGMMGDEACMAVDQYLDEAVMNDCESVRLIHGKGTGALKTAIWRFLKGDRRIESFRIGRYGEGDGGVTVVTLK